MPKPKPPAWLTTAFAEGVLELAPPRPAPAYKGALGRCWLAQHDPRQRPCSGPFERFHFIPRQRVENAMEAQLPAPTPCDECRGTGRAFDDVDDLNAILAATPCPACFGTGTYDLAPVRLLAAWDPRNGGVGCEGHHRRYDSHLTPTLKLHAATLFDHTIDFIFDWGLESEAERRFDNFIRY